ncbi:MAG TPA: M28 family peptidase [Anaerolineaceae bacterium]|nr:M28 family peptidase [Anaerolineaceae bacterium]HQP07410.1 M28 family peptidase [Anaerolineaceae bacterium]
MTDPLVKRSEKILHFFCDELPSRRVGSSGNQRATAYFAEALLDAGFRVETPPFACLDWEEEGASLAAGGKEYPVLPGPFSTGFTGSGELVTAGSVAELETLAMQDKILLLRGEATASQLMPKNFRFYNPEAHQHIYALVENGKPKAVITATGKNPELAGAAYPFPMFEDGDFEFPSVYMKDVDGEELAKLSGTRVSLEIHARRIPSTGCNVLAIKPGRESQKVVVCAHIDAKRGTPGALDNATGSTVLLLLGELLRDYRGRLGVEIVAINGEDYYASPGEIQYLDMNASAMENIFLAVNMDGVGLKGYPTAFSFYGCPPAVEGKARSSFLACGLVQGEEWYQGDHSIFLQQNRPAIALTTQDFGQFISQIVHTPEDTLANVDPQELARIARCLAGFIQSL